MSDLEAVIASAVTDLHDAQDVPADPGSTDGDSTPESDTAAADPTPADPVDDSPLDASVDPEDPLAKELNLKPRPDGKENRIPYSRVRAIKANAERKAVEQALAPVAKVLGVDPKTLTVESLEQALSGRIADPEIAAEVEHMRGAEQFMRDDPDGFVRRLAEVMPDKFGKFAQFLDGGGQAGPAAAQPAAAVPGPASARPEPDLELEGGGRTYSVEGIQKLIDWAATEGERRAAARIDERFKPIQEREQQAKQAEAEREAAARAQADREARAKAELEDALANWDGFKEHFDEIMNVLRADPTRRMRLETAWRQVVVPKIKADRAKMREELLKELQTERRAAATSTVTGGVAPAVPDGPKATEDIIRESIAHLRR